jgi:replicative DNA helicase
MERLAAPDLEATYLSCALVDHELLDKHPVPVPDVWSPTHAALLGAMVSIRARSEPLDMASIRIELEQRGKLHHFDALFSLMDRLPIPSEGPTAARRIRELAAFRRGRDCAMLAASHFIEGDRAEAQHALDCAGSELARQDETNMGTVRTAVSDAILELRTRAARGRPAFVATGIQALDFAIGGGEYGDLWVLGGDTSVGKTSTALLMGFAMDRAGHRVGIVSMEDPQARMGRRVLSMLSGVPAVALRKGDLSPWQWEAMDQAVTRVMGTQITIAYRIGETITEAREAIRMLRTEHGCDVIFVDYAQAVRVPGVEERIAMREVCAAVKGECNRGASPALAFLLSQFKRRENVHAQPKRSDLYESAYLEQKADGIILLWKDEGGFVNGVLDKAKDDATGVVFTLERDARTGMLKEVA